MIIDPTTKLIKSDIPQAGRMESEYKTTSGFPIIDILPDPTRNTLHLKFIRSEPPVFDFTHNLNYVICYAKKQGYDNVSLQDDALFTDKDDKECIFRALFYRVFINKYSIYVDKGFTPTTCTMDELNKIKNILYNFKIINAKELSLFLPKKIQKRILEIPTSKDDARFGEWLVNQDCMFFREVINRILDKKLIENIVGMSEELIIFIKFAFAYLDIHQSLTQNVSQCKTNKSSKGTRGRLRRGTLFTSRKPKLRRKSVSRKSNRKRHKKNPSK